jgi:NADPH2:quinone reductase
MVVEGCEQSEWVGFWSRVADSLASRHPHEVVPGGLGRIQQALTNLKSGKTSTVKYEFRVEDTDGVSKT